MNVLQTVSLLFLTGVLSTEVAAAGRYLVKDGQPRAEIVIAESPSRSTRLAAAELRTYVEKISGAVLPIVTQPTADVSMHVYVGRSPHTARLGIPEEALKYGAYRIASGEDWLVLIGDDSDFIPREPWARNNRDRTSGKLQQEWEKVAGGPWGVPNGGMYKNRQALPADIGQPDGVTPRPNEKFEIWTYDERGSFNAVCGFLRSLGVRWYMPGELGEVVPQQGSILLPDIDETVRPDFEVRQFNIRFGTASHDSMMWAMRLGIRNPYGLMVAHGMHEMTQTETNLREHPEWFALYGGKRDTERGKRLNHLCYSNEELFRQTVLWARAQFDVYDFDTVSIMPPDAYIAICQCPLCQGKDVPEMGSRGKLSNHVWDFVNRVAKEVARTHPDKQIVCCAYGANTEPPTNIDQLEPNVQVVIVGGRRPRNNLPEQQADVRRLREGWLKKTHNPLLIFENYPFTDRGFYLPAFVSKTMGESINATKGISRGEDIWLSWRQDFETVGVGFNHFQVYFTARMYWGGPEQDATAMLDEYCRLFYGPAGPDMKRFFEYCETNWQSMETDAARVETALSLFATAKEVLAQAKAAPPTDEISTSQLTVYSQRLGLIDQFLDALRSKAKLLAQKRGPVPTLRTVWAPKEPIVIDGRLDDQYWRECPTSSIGSLRELQTGRQPIFGTTVKAGWNGGDLYFAIRCDEHSGEPLNVATTENEDQAIWYGDVVEVELATDSHSYYQLAVNPSGALIDLDRGADKSAWSRWDSQAEVATHVADDPWTIEIRIPVTEDENDPLNQVIGRKPSQSLPWHFNVCRQRIRENGSEYSAFSPTGSATYHHPMKFGYLYEGRSHAFDVDPTVTDFLIASHAAADLVRQRKYSEAMTAYETLTAGQGVTPLQVSDAFAHAARCARLMKDIDHADALADRIPLEVVASTVRMENLAARGNQQAVVDQYGKEDLAAWPFWQIGPGAFLRGTAYSAIKIGDKAEADLQLALEYTSDTRTRMSLLRAIAVNRENVLQDDQAALETYRLIADSTINTGSAEYYTGLQGAARILTRQMKFDEALQILSRVDPQKLSGTWRRSLLLATGQTLAAAGRDEAAAITFQKVANDEDASPQYRRAAQAAIADLMK